MLPHPRLLLPNRSHRLLQLIRVIRITRQCEHDFLHARIFNNYRDKRKRMHAIHQTIKQIQYKRYTEREALTALDIQRTGIDSKQMLPKVTLKEIKDELVDKLCQIGPIRVIIEDYLDGDYHTYHLRLASRLYILWKQGCTYFHYNPRIGYITNHRDQTFKITRIKSGEYQIGDTLVLLPQTLTDYVLNHFTIPIDHEDVQLVTTLIHQFFYQ